MVKGSKMSEESKLKISKNHAKWNKGRKETRPEVLKKLSDSHKNQVAWNKGKKGYSTNRKGFIMPQETKDKIRKTKIEKRETYKTWKGGISRGKNKKEYYLFKCKQRIYRRKNANGNFTQGEWELLKKQYNYTCPCCHKSEPKIKLTADHIIPLSKGGSNYIENIQPLCGSCNCKKHTKIIKYDIE